jgi:hypothetical protein
MSGRDKSPAIEDLEVRAVPSSIPFLSSGLSSMLGAHTQGNPAPVLSGSISGTLTQTIGMPDVGFHFTLHGTGKLSILGQVAATGNMHGVGFVAAGHAQGTLVLTNAHGTLTLHLDGTLQHGFSHLPNHFYFNVVKGTGSYAHVMASGTIELHQVPMMEPFHLLPGQTPPASHTSVFVMTIRQITI